MRQKKNRLSEAVSYNEALASNRYAAFAAQSRTFKLTSVTAVRKVNYQPNGHPDHGYLKSLRVKSGDHGQANDGAQGRN